MYKRQVTPFTKETVDLPTLGKLLDFQMKNGTDAIIVCGTTGEASTMSYRERMRTIEFLSLIHIWLSAS